MIWIFYCIRFLYQSCFHKRLAWMIFIKTFVYQFFACFSLKILRSWYITKLVSFNNAELNHTLICSESPVLNHNVSFNHKEILKKLYFLWRNWRLFLVALKSRFFTVIYLRKTLNNFNQFIVLQSIPAINFNQSTSSIFRNDYLRIMNSF